MYQPREARKRLASELLRRGACYARAFKRLSLDAKHIRCAAASMGRQHKEVNFGQEAMHDEAHQLFSADGYITNSWEPVSLQLRDREVEFAFPEHLSIEKKTRRSALDLGGLRIPKYLVYDFVFHFQSAVEGMNQPNGIAVASTNVILNSRQYSQWAIMLLCRTMLNDTVFSVGLSNKLALLKLLVQPLAVHHSISASIKECLTRLNAHFVSRGLTTLNVLEWSAESSTS